MADSKISPEEAAVARISSCYSVREVSIRTVLKPEISPYQDTVSFATVEFYLAVVHMVGELGRHATVDEFIRDLERLSVAVPEPPTGTLQLDNEDWAQLRILYKRCPLALSILKDHKEKYLNSMTILNTELKKKMSGVYSSVATDEWPKEEAGRLQDLVGKLPHADKHDGYLEEITAYWKDFAGEEQAQLYQKGWEFVAGHKLHWEAARGVLELSTTMRPSYHQHA